MFIVITIVTVLTYTISSEEYGRVDLVDSDSFHFIEFSPVYFLEMFNSIHRFKRGWFVLCIKIS